MTRPGAAEFAAAGIWDPHAADADSRLRILELVADTGASLEQIIAAARDERLTWVGARHVMLGGAPTRSLRELATECGIDVETAARVWQMLGFAPPDPDDVCFTDRDLAVFAGFALAREQYGEDVLAHMVRVVGASMARIADASSTLFSVAVAQPLETAGLGEDVIMAANLETQAVIEALPELLDAVFRHHMYATAERVEAARRVEVSYDTLRHAVGFVDLVGFTPLSHSLEPAELADLVDRFEARASDLVAAHHGRLVKFIGDEAMFVTSDPAAACEIALALVDSFRDEEAVSPRGAVAAGDLLSRGGDYYGAVVNLAARVADHAVPEEILVPRSLLDEIGDDHPGLEFAPAGRRMLRGFPQPVELLSVTRARPTP